MGMINPTRHKLKTESKYFHAFKLGVNTFEVRKDDRGFQVGDILHLTEIDAQGVGTGNEHVSLPIRYILRGGQFGIEKGYVVLGF